MNTLAASPELGRFVLTPIFVEVQTGNDMAPELEEAHGGLDPDPRINAYVESVGLRMLPFSKRNDMPHKFQVLKSRKIINAFALGNGNTYVTRGLLELLEDEAQLAEIVGHEIAHVSNRHIGQRIDQVLGITAVAAVAEALFTARKGGKVSEGSQSLIDAAKAVIPSLIINGFGRAQELESDEDGLKWMARAGYDPRASVEVFQKFQEMEGEVKGLAVFFSSHPTAKKRISELRSEIQRRFPRPSGERFRERYQSIVFGAASPSNLAFNIDRKMTPAAAAGIAAGLIIPTVLAVAL